MRTFRIWLVLAAVLLASTARAGDVDYNSGVYGPIDAGTWNGSDNINVEAISGGTTLADIVVNVDSATIGGAGIIVNENLHIITDGSFSTKLNFLDAASEQKPLRVMEDVHLTGDSVANKTAGLSIGSNYHIHVDGTTYVRENSTVTLGGANSVFRTGNLAIGVDLTSNPDGRDALVRVDAGGKLIMTGYTAVGNYGTLQINNGGVVRLKDMAAVSGTDATLEMNGSSTISLAKNAILGVTNGGTLHITGDAVIKYEAPSATPGDTANDPFETGEAEMPGVDPTYAVLIDTDGSMAIDAGASLATDYLIFAGTGTGTIDAGGVLSVAELAITENAVMNVSGEINEVGASAISTRTITVGGGALNVLSGGSIDFSTLKATGGTVDIGLGSTVDIDSLEAGGTSVVSIRGTVTHGNVINAIGSGKVQFLSGMKIDNGGADGSLGQLGVHNSAIVEVGTAVTVDALAFGGGQIDMAANSTLTVLSPSATSASGKLNYNGDNAKVVFDGPVVFNNGGIFSAGGVVGNMELNSNRLEIGRNAVLDTSKGGFIAEGASGFTLNGTLHVGYDRNVIMADIRSIGSGGELSVGQNAQVTMTSEMQRQAMASFSTGGLQVLKTDATTASGLGTLYWDNISVIYQYDVRQDASGGYGIWVTGSKAVSRDKLRNDIREQWSQRWQVGEDVRSVIRDDFLEAVIDANRLVTGVDVGYDRLSSSGKFNADALSSFVNPTLTGAGYDALMLYNGSGLAMASEVVVSSNSQMLRRVNQRSENLRREIRGNDVMDPDSYCPDPLPVGRVWADSVYHVDKAAVGDGFAGHDYSGAGFIVGYDRVYGNLAVGGAASYLAGNYEDRSALSHGSRIDTYGLDLYGTLTSPSGWFLAGALGYGYTDNRMRDYRVLNGIEGWNSGDYGSHTLKISASFGKDFWIGEYLTVSPSLGFEYVGMRSAEHIQHFVGDKRAGGANTLAAGVVKNHSSRAPISLAASYNVAGNDESLFMLTGNIGYAYEFNDQGASGSVGYEGLQGVIGPVGIARRDPGRHVIMAGLRGQYYYKQYEFGAGYEYVGKRRYHSHTVSLNAGMSF